MGKKKKLLDLKKNLATIKSNKLSKLTGGKQRSRFGWKGCGGIVPQ